MLPEFTDSYELASIFTIGTNSVFLDAESKTMLGSGPPAWLREHSEQPIIRRFLNRGEAAQQVNP